MKRTSIKRKTPLRRVNHKRKAKLREKQFADHGKWIEQQPCLISQGCMGDIVSAHVKSRGAGGLAKDIVPLCVGHHSEQGQIGIKTFARKYGLDLKAEAERLWEENGSDDG